MVTSNIVEDIKQGFIEMINRNIEPVASIPTSDGGVAPSAKKPSVTTLNIVRSPQIMPIIQIILVEERPTLAEGQTYNARVFYRDPNPNVPGVVKSVTDEAGNVHTGPYYRMRYFKPQTYIFRFRFNIFAETESQCEDVHLQLQTLFEGQRMNLLRVHRNEDDEATYDETFRFYTVFGRHFPYDGEIPRSVIEVDVQAYMDTNQPPQKVFRITGFNHNQQIIE